MNEEFQKILNKIGLTLQESKVYLALLTLQESQTGLLCKETNIASSNIYGILASLKAKGLISYKVKNRIKIFMPSPPEALNEIFVEKQKKLEEEKKEVQKLISKLKVKKVEDSESNYKYFEGISGIKSLWQEIILSVPALDKSTIIKVYGGEKEAYEKLLGFYKEFQKARRKNKIKQHTILPHGETRIPRMKEFKDMKIHYEDLKNKAEWGVIGDLFFIQYIMTKTPKGFLVKDKIFAQTMEQVFNQIWKESK